MKVGMWGFDEESLVLHHPDKQKTAIQKIGKAVAKPSIPAFFPKTMTPSNHGETGGYSEGRLEFGILGAVPSTPRERLEKYIGEVDWSYLKPHFATGALVYVDPSLSLSEVGHAFSLDDAARVRDWRSSGDIVTPSQPHADHWEECGARFLALVVSPFVLIQPLGSK